MEEKKDIGCNSGLYSFFASMKGAKYVLGIDKCDPDYLSVSNAISQATDALRIFKSQGKIIRTVEFKELDITKNLEIIDNFDVVMANAVLYYLGPLDALKRKINDSSVSTLVIQWNIDRKNFIGAKNKPGVEGYEHDNKTWGNIVVLIPGAKKFITDCEFNIHSVNYEKEQHPVIVGVR